MRTSTGPCAIRRVAAAAVFTFFGAMLAGATAASAQQVEHDLTSVLSPPPSSSLVPASIDSIRLPLAPDSKWKASYGLGRADETALTWQAQRFDQTLAFGTRHDGETRNEWRHFLGVEYAPVEGFSFLGGFAKAGGLWGGKHGSTAPSGYEKLRFNAGARWRNEDWGVDGSFSFIPTGVGRAPSDASFFPGGGGGGGATYFLSLSVSRRF